MIYWDPELETGHALIDEQHRRLFREVAILVEGVERGESAKAVREFLPFIKLWMCEHFKSEESEMLRSNYPWFVEHRTSHQRMAKTMKDFDNELSHEGVNEFMVKRLVQEMSEWMRIHSFRMDYALARWLSPRIAAESAAHAAPQGVFEGL